MTRAGRRVRTSRIAPRRREVSHRRSSRGPHRAGARKHGTQRASNASIGRYDQISAETIAKYQAGFADGSALLAHYHFPGRKAQKTPRVDMMFYVPTPRLHLVSGHDVSFSVDGSSFAVPRSAWKARMKGNKILDDRVIFTVSQPLCAAIRTAKDVEFRVGKYSGKITGKQLAKLKAFLPAPVVDGTPTDAGAPADSGQ